MPRIKMTSEQIELDKNVLNLRKAGIPFREIAKQYGLTKSKLQAIYTRLGVYQKPTKEQNEKKRDIFRRNKAIHSGPRTKRICKICGKDPSPNWFYCHGECHKQASDYVWGIDDDQDHRLNLGKVNGATISKPMGV